MITIKSNLTEITFITIVLKYIKNKTKQKQTNRKLPKIPDKNCCFFYKIGRFVSCF